MNKTADLEKVNSTSDESTLKNYDEALRFINEKKSLDEQIKVEKRTMDSKLMWKIDLCLIPVMCMIYFLQFLDKTLINYAAVMGIKKNLKGNEFANLATIFYAAYIFFEPMNSYLLQKLPLAKFLSFTIIAWGIIVACHSACHTYASLMIVRTLLGAFEGPVAVCLIAISGMYWDHKQQLRRMGLWSIQAGTGSIIGGLLSFAFQHIENKTFQSWQIFFLVIGVITFFFGIFTWFYLPDNPTKAWFLTEEEKMIVIEHVRNNQTGVENKIFKKEQIMELLFKDKHTWPMFFLTIVSQICTGAISTFSVTIIKTFGFSNKVSALAQMPAGAAVIICILMATYICAHFGHRTLIFISMCIPSIVGYIVMISSKDRIGNLLSVYLLSSGSCVITLIYSWNNTNTAGYTKRIGRNCMTMIAFAVGCLIGPQLFRDQDYPRYIPAKITLLVTMVVSILLVIVVALISRFENQKKERAEAMELPENYEFLDMTDLQNPNFRYAY
ncbi:hypothetical protein WICANDRAFT_85797 [Wickerhamomyces anomalus NRRL Y-366-8]|uniref:Major facilitator superfamily (MFS) profile domain-containing protein n=1 Tax=Wickerhamomyces anomalus (strain ATCC 58044 / CBS 1984 / NCYC 433 / NRRL Y-366-8) TaxID=683960 RepID=A0A1E3NYP4_WICAA|nr:uncharacterized protein WICANDRAFT_85797 [Wickerhamomyces anomalus NRRL Y-366-8]ODQ57697.1 hypothetical protein WICANDRAFT_85797 [Wickerhamomyces anomalus NRRL Y-366-8]